MIIIRFHYQFPAFISARTKSLKGAYCLFSKCAALFGSSAHVVQDAHRDEYVISDPSFSRNYCVIPLLSQTCSSPTAHVGSVFLYTVSAAQVKAFLKDFLRLGWNVRPQRQAGEYEDAGNSQPVRDQRCIPPWKLRCNLHNEHTLVSLGDELYNINECRLCCRAAPLNCIC